MSQTLNLVSALTRLACRWQAQGRDSDAHQLLDRLSSFRNPGCVASATALVRLARLEFRRHHFRRARGHLVRALKLRPKDARARYLLARALERDPRTSPATVSRQYRLALKLDGHRPLWWAAYGRYLARIGRVDAGLRALRQALGLAPANVRLAAVLVKVLMWAGRVEEAERQARAISFQQPGGAALWENVRFQQARHRQMSERRQAAETERPVVLPFVRPVDAPATGRPAPGRVLRRDRAARPAPHLLRRSDAKRAP